jgi:carbamoyltransferase
MYILGIWDGHDAGAAIVKNDRILVAINEERLSRRKLEIGFPEKSIQACLKYLNLTPKEISCIAVPTYDFAKTLTRLFPSLREEYYRIRRRKKEPGRLRELKKMSKYILTEFGPSPITKYISQAILKKDCKRSGLTAALYLFDHHLCHAAAAAFCSGFDEAAVITLDGIGDGLSGSIRLFQSKELRFINSISGKSSLGIFFEHVTNLLNMRELEDEGKVMALANYAYPIDDKKNPLLDFFQIKDTDIQSRYGSFRMYQELKKILWRYPSEQFAGLAQRVLEVKITELVRNVIEKTGLKKVALAGGIFSNIKVNMQIRELPGVTDCFVFPHMGDGGLALGAALWANYQSNKAVHYQFDDVFFGMDYQDEEIEKTLIKHNLTYAKKDNIVREVARLIADEEIVFWFQGRMEYGPRALGNRSILALPNSEIIKNRLNLKLKMRVWYQPFCPSVLDEDAEKILDAYSGTPNRFMTMAYRVKPEWAERLKGVISIDGTCRPQIVTPHENRYYALLQEIRKLTGTGIVLNTSLNIHGDPLVCSPEDAIETFLLTKNKYMAMHDFLVTG